MNTLAVESPPLAVGVRCSDDMVCVVLADGREIAAPLVWFPRLFNATPEQRRNWRLIGGGVGIHWEEIDEDLSAEGLLQGSAALGRQTVNSLICHAIGG